MKNIRPATRASGREFSSSIVVPAVVLAAMVLGAAGGYAMKLRPAPMPQLCAADSHPASLEVTSAPSHSTWQGNPALMDSSWRRWPSLTDF